MTENEAIIFRVHNSMISNNEFKLNFLNRYIIFKAQKHVPKKHLSNCTISFFMYDRDNIIRNLTTIRIEWK